MISFATCFKNGEPAHLVTDDVLRFPDRVGFKGKRFVFFDSQNRFPEDALDDISLTAKDATITVIPRGGLIPAVFYVSFPDDPTFAGVGLGSLTNTTYKAFFPEITGSGSAEFLIPMLVSGTDSTLSVGTLAEGETKYFDISVTTAVKTTDILGVTAVTELPTGVEFSPPPRLFVDGSGNKTIRVYVTSTINETEHLYRQMIDLPSHSSQATTTSTLKIANDYFAQNNIARASEAEGFAVHNINFVGQPYFRVANARNTLKTINTSATTVDPNAFSMTMFSLINRGRFSCILSKFKRNTVNVDLPTNGAGHVTLALTTGITNVTQDDYVMCNYNTVSNATVFKSAIPTAANEITLNYRYLATSNPAAEDWEFFSMPKTRIGKVTGIGGTYTLASTNVPNNTTVDVTTTVTGAAVGDFVIHFPPANMADEIIPLFSYVSAANTVITKFRSYGGTVGTTWTNPAGSWGFLVIPFDNRRVVGNVQIRLTAIRGKN